MPRQRDLPRGQRGVQIQGGRGGSGAGRVAQVGGGGGARPAGVVGPGRARNFSVGTYNVQVGGSWGLRALANSFGQLAQVGEQVMNAEFKKRAEAVEREQSLLGSEYGLGTDIDQLQLPAGDSVGDEAFRRSAILASKANVDVAAYDDVAELAKSHPGKPEAFKAALTDRVKAFVSKLPPEMRPDAATQYARLGQQQYFKLDDERREFERDQNRASIMRATEIHSTAATRAARMGDWDYAQEELGKLGALVSSAGPVELGGSGALSLQEIEKQSQATNDAARESFLMGWVDRSSNPQAVINAIRSGKSGNPILDDILAQTDPGKLDPIVRSMEVDIRQREATARMEARQARAIANAEARLRKADVKAAVGDAVFALNQGKIPPNLKEVAGVASQYADLAPELDKALGRQQAAADFALRPAGERISILNQLAADPEMGRDEIEFVQALSARHQDIENDPDKYNAAVEAGLVAPTELDLNDPQSIATRVAQADEIESQWGDRVSGLRNDEIDSITEAMKEMTPEEQAATLARLNDGMGERFDLVLPKIADKEPATAMAAKVAKEQPQLGADILRGQSLIKDGTVSKADPQSYAKASDDKIGLALKNSPSAAAAVRAAAQALEANSRFNSGKTDQDSYDEDTYRDSIDQVIGGIYDYNDVPIVAPERGVNEDTFAEIMQQVGADDLSVTDAAGIPMLPVLPGGGELTPEAFHKYATLESVGQGRYLVKVANGYAIDPVTQQSFVFDWGTMTNGARKRIADGQRSRREGLLGVPGDDALGGGAGADVLAPGVGGTLSIPLNPSVSELMRRLLGTTMKSNAPIPEGANAPLAEVFGLKKPDQQRADKGS